MGTIRCAAILFDLDGVLIDSEAAVQRAWEQWTARHGLELRHVLTESRGRRTADTIRAVAPWLDEEAESRDLERAQSADTDGVTALAGAASLLDSLPPQTWAVVTSGTRRLAGARLTAANLPLPTVLLAAEDVEHGKPDPEPYLLAAAALGVEPGSCLVVEDAPSGIAAGKAAGATVLALLTTFAASELAGADHRAPSLAALRLRRASRDGDELELVLES